MKCVGAFLVALCIALPVSAQTTAVPAPAPAVSAQYEFMMARQLENGGDLAGAKAALERAIKLDPSSAELHAELAGYHARQDDADDALKEANQALNALKNDAVRGAAVLQV